MRVRVWGVINNLTLMHNCSVGGSNTRFVACIVGCRQQEGAFGTCWCHCSNGSVVRQMLQVAAADLREGGMCCVPAVACVRAVCRLQYCIAGTAQEVLGCCSSLSVLQFKVL